MGSVKYKEVEENGQLTVKEIHKVVVYQFSVGDVEDPDLYAAQYAITAELESKKLSEFYLRWGKNGNNKTR